MCPIQVCRAASFNSFTEISELHNLCHFNDIGISASDAPACKAMEDAALVPLNPPSGNTPQPPQHERRKYPGRRSGDGRRRPMLQRQQTSLNDQCHSIDEPSFDHQPELRGSLNNGSVHEPIVRPGRRTSSNYGPSYITSTDTTCTTRQRKSKCSSCNCCFPKCRKRRRRDQDDLTEDDIQELEGLKDPPRKRCLRAFFNFLYILLAIIAIVVTYSMIQDLVTAMQNPVRSIHYKRVENYEAPGKDVCAINPSYPSRMECIPRHVHICISCMLSNRSRTLF